MSRNTSTIDALAAKVDALADLVAALAADQLGSGAPKVDALAAEPKVAAKKATAKKAKGRKLAKWSQGMYTRYGIEPVEGYVFHSKAGNGFRVVEVLADHVMAERI